jgi:hypothetical protein
MALEEPAVKHPRRETPPRHVEGRDVSHQFLRGRLEVPVELEGASRQRGSVPFQVHGVLGTDQRRLANPDAAQSKYARYAYATLEAERLIERHGVDCLRQILDEVVAGRTHDSAHLFAAIQKVTGEDLGKRFARYQPFETKDDCVKHYAEQHNAAADRKDYAEALPAMLRILEFRGLKDPRFYSNAAFLLYRMGYEKAGD